MMADPLHSSPAVLLFVFLRRVCMVYVKARSFPCLKYMMFILVARAGDHQMVSISQPLLCVCVCVCE